MPRRHLSKVERRKVGLQHCVGRPQLGLGLGAVVGQHLLAVAQAFPGRPSAGLESRVWISRWQRERPTWPTG